MPLDEEFGPQIYSSNADLQNVRFPSLFHLYHWNTNPNHDLHLMSRPEAAPQEAAPLPCS